MLTTMPLLQGRAAPYREVSHQFSPVGKENQGLEVAGGGGGDTSFPKHCGSLYGELYSDFSQ